MSTRMRRINRSSGAADKLFIRRGVPTPIASLPPRTLAVLSNIRCILIEYFDRKFVNWIVLWNWIFLYFLFTYLLIDLFKLCSLIFLFFFYYVLLHTCNFLKWLLSVSSLNVLIEDCLRYQVVQLIFLFMYPSRMLSFLLCFLLISSFICMISSNIHRSIFIGDSLMAWLWNYSFFFFLCFYSQSHTHICVYRSISFLLVLLLWMNICSILIERLGLVFPS